MNPRADDISLELDQIKLIVNPTIGCSIASLMIRDQTNQSNQTGEWIPVLRSMDKDSVSASDAGSFAMLPWTNRVKDANFVFQGESYALAGNCSDGSAAHAIHGVGRDLPWRIADRSPITARFVLDSRSFMNNELNYPFAFGAVQRFEIAPNRVDIDLSITNLDTHPIPVGCGHHPYIHRHLMAGDDDLRLKLDVAGRYPLEGCIPVGEPVFDSVCASLRRGDPIGNPGLDDVFAGFGGQAIFDWDQSGIRMTMACSKNLGHLVVYTPIDADGQADELVCVEPVSMVNDGYNAMNRGDLDTGVVVLDPNETMRTRMSLVFERR